MDFNIQEHFIKKRKKLLFETVFFIYFLINFLVST